MGTGKKEAARKERQGKTSDGLGNVKVKGENFYRNAKKVKLLKTFTDGKAQRNAAGKITKAASYQSRDKPNARIEPNRKWFTNTRVIAQDSLAQFRDAVAKNQADPYSYLLKQNKLPMSLITDGGKTRNGIKQHEAKIAVETKPFVDTFGPKAQRKRVKLSVETLADLAGHSEKMHEEYLDRREQADLLAGKGDAAERNDDAEPEDDGGFAVAKDPIFSKGQSKRIYNELYKVIDSSDVVIHVLDARDPEGTRCRKVETYLKEEHPHKHLLFVLNKCDLVPTSVAATWVRLLGKEHPTLAFHASITNSFGKGSLIQVLRQFSQLHSNRKQISVGFIGYPNTGKSSIINTLRKKKVCKVAPIPGQTVVWQYITLMKRIYLIDCPGVVPPNPNDTAQDILLRGVVRVENVSNPAQYIDGVLARCKARHVQKTYDVPAFKDSVEFLEMLARKSGKLLKGGEADLDSVAKSVINDFLRGKIPWFMHPPSLPGSNSHSHSEATSANADDQLAEAEAEAKGEALGGRTGDVARLNKLPAANLRDRKRKRVDADAEESVGQDESVTLAQDDSFTGFGSEDNDDDEADGNSDSDHDPDGVELVIDSDDDAALDDDDDDDDDDDGDSDSVDDHGGGSDGGTEVGGRTI